ncbi:MAG: radical SAM protein [Lentisphaeria bacterium]|nr:radical SAM protein [Lentisphaeria bacterium]
MLQIMLTDHCNQSCAYCFAKEKLTHATRTELTLDDLDYLINLHRAWGIQHMSLAGGEPTLHSQFEEVIERIEAAEVPFVHLFTNGQMPRRRADFLARWENLTFLVNHSPRETYAPAAWENHEYFLGACSTTCMRMSIGTTIYEPEPELDFLHEAAVRHGLSVVRLGLAHPIYYNHGEVVNQFLSLEDCRVCAESVVAFAERCASDSIHMLFDCHFPLCMFTPEQFARLHAAQPDNLPCFDLDCCQQITIKPNLAVFACFATGALFHQRTLREFSTQDELQDYFAEAFELFEAAPGYDVCETCEAFRRECSGGCLGQKLVNFPAPPEYVEKQMAMDGGGT